MEHATLFLADFTDFFVASATSSSLCFPFPALCIYSFTLLEIAMNADFLVSFLAHP